MGRRALQASLPGLLPSSAGSWPSNLDHGDLSQARAWALYKAQLPAILPKVPSSLPGLLQSAAAQGPSKERRKLGCEKGNQLERADAGGWFMSLPILAGPRPSPPAPSWHAESWAHRGSSLGFREQGRVLQKHDNPVALCLRVTRAPLCMDPGGPAPQLGFSSLAQTPVGLEMSPVLML